MNNLLNTLLSRYPQSRKPHPKKMASSESSESSPEVERKSCHILSKQEQEKFQETLKLQNDKARKGVNFFYFPPVNHHGKNKKKKAAPSAPPQPVRSGSAEVKEGAKESVKESANESANESAKESVKEEKPKKRPVKPSKDKRRRSFAYVWFDNIVVYGGSVYNPTPKSSSQVDVPQVVTFKNLMEFLGSSETPTFSSTPERVAAWNYKGERMTALGRLTKRPIAFVTNAKNHFEVRQEIIKNAFKWGVRSKNPVKGKEVVLSELD